MCISPHNPFRSAPRLPSTLPSPSLVLFPNSRPFLLTAILLLYEDPRRLSLPHNSPSPHLSLPSPRTWQQPRWTKSLADESCDPPPQGWSTPHAVSPAPPLTPPPEHLSSVTSPASGDPERRGFIVHATERENSSGTLSISILMHVCGTRPRIQT